MQRPARITMGEAMQTVPDKGGWRPMSCAPRYAADDEEAQPIVLGITENDIEFEIAWNPSAKAWRSHSEGNAITGRFIAWRPVNHYDPPEERTMALSLADNCELQAQKHDAMAPFVPQEKKKAEQERNLRDKYLAVANAGR